MPPSQLTVQDLQALLAKIPSGQRPGFCVLDVRTPGEYVTLGHIPGARLLPLHELPLRWQELDPEVRTLVICQHGVRSLEACYHLDLLGFRDVVNIVEGMAAWQGPVAFEPPAL